MSQLNPIRENEIPVQRENPPLEKRVRIVPFWPSQKTPNDFADTGIQFQGGPQKRSGYKLALWTWFSVSIDAMVMLACSCFFLVIFSWIMQTQFTDVVLQLKSQVGLTQLFAMSFVICFWAYLIFMRVFNSATVGEMTCSLRLGQPSERMKGLYVARVLVRTTVILITGILPLPLLSLIFGRDLAGDLVGLKIYSLK